MSPTGDMVALENVNYVKLVGFEIAHFTLPLNVNSGMDSKPRHLILFREGPCSCPGEDG